MWMYVGVGAQLHSLLISAIYVDKWLASGTVSFKSSGKLRELGSEAV
jgi:hypothetical protein